MVVFEIFMLMSLLKECSYIALFILVVMMIREFVCHP